MIYLAGTHSMESAEKKNYMQRSKTGCATDNYCSALFCSVLFFSRPRSEGWPYHGRKLTFSIYLYPLSF